MASSACARTMRERNSACGYGIVSLIARELAKIEPRRRQMAEMGRQEADSVVRKRTREHMPWNHKFVVGLDQR